jgi:hypothetical protein
MGFIKIFPQNIKDKISLKKDSDSLWCNLSLFNLRILK